VQSSAGEALGVPPGKREKVGFVSSWKTPLEGSETQIIWSHLWNLQKRSSERGGRPLKRVTSTIHDQEIPAGGNSVQELSVVLVRDRKRRKIPKKTWAGSPAKRAGRAQGQTHRVMALVISRGRGVF